MADSRVWAKIDVGYLENPKIVDLVEENPRAVILHLAAILYSRRHLTDGVVPMRIAMRIACATHSDVQCAVENGLLEVDEAGRRVIVHDYSDHQQTADQVNRVSQGASLAARKRWDAERTAERNAPGNAERTTERNAEKRREDTTSANTDAGREDVTRLCSLLADLIEKNGSKRPVISKAWQREARLMLDRDGRKLDDAERVMRWCQSDEFWKSNILSMPTFRAKFDQLRLKAPAKQRPDPVAAGMWEGAW